VSDGHGDVAARRTTRTCDTQILYRPRRRQLYGGTYESATKYVLGIIGSRQLGGGATDVRLGRTLLRNVSNLNVVAASGFKIPGITPNSTISRTRVTPHRDTRDYQHITQRVAELVPLFPLEI
jgi:hypothetical protein